MTLYVFVVALTTKTVVVIANTHTRLLSKPDNYNYANDHH